MSSLAFLVSFLGEGQAPLCDCSFGSLIPFREKWESREAVPAPGRSGPRVPAGSTRHEVLTSGPPFWPVPPACLLLPITTLVLLSHGNLCFFLFPWFSSCSYFLTRPHPTPTVHSSATISPTLHTNLCLFLSLCKLLMPRTSSHLCTVHLLGELLAIQPLCCS